MATPKETAKKLLEQMSNESTWNDIMYNLYVKQKIELGIADIEKSRTFPQNQIKEKVLNKTQAK